MLRITVVQTFNVQKFNDREQLFVENYKRRSEQSGGRTGLVPQTYLISKLGFILIFAEPLIARGNSLQRQNRAAGRRFHLERVERACKPHIGAEDAGQLD